VTPEKELEVRLLKGEIIESFKRTRRKFYPHVPEEIFICLQQFLWAAVPLRVSDEMLSGKTLLLASDTHDTINQAIEDWFQTMKDHRSEILADFVERREEEAEENVQPLGDTINVHHVQ
jgi:hypothetical protein